MRRIVYGTVSLFFGLGVLCAGALVEVDGVERVAQADTGSRNSHKGDDIVYSKKEQRYKHKEGEYGGVTPGVIYPYNDEGYAHRKKRRANKGKRCCRISWIGFQAQDGGSARLFAQMSSELTFSQEIVGRHLYVYVHKARLTNRNAGRRLDMSHFGSSIADVNTRRVGRTRAHKGRPGHPRGVRIAVNFKSAADVRDAQASVAQEKDGYYYLFLDFGPETTSSNSGDTKGDRRVERAGDDEP